MAYSEENTVLEAPIHQETNGRTAIDTGRSLRLADPDQTYSEGSSEVEEAVDPDLDGEAPPPSMDDDGSVATRGPETGSPVASPASPPGAADELNDRGIVLARSGRVDDAIACYHQAIELRPGFAEAFNNLGIAMCHLGRHDEAIERYQEALRLKPDYPEAENNLGITLVRTGRFVEACEHFRGALRFRPDFPEARNNLANSLRHQGQIDDAIAEYRRALESKPDYPEAHNNLANALAEQDQLEEALSHYQHAIRLNPTYAEAHNNYANTLTRVGRIEEAEQSYRRALRHNPDYAEAYNNVGNLLSDQSRLAEAVACYRQALSLKPDYAEGYNNLGITLGKQRKHADAEVCYREALKWKPDYPDAHLNRALGWLVAGNFEQGWPEYEWRWHCRGINRHTYPQPAWAGEPLDGKTILIYYEQGLGDTLEFVRYLPMVKRRGGTVVLDCQPQLVPMLSRCAGIDRLVPRGSPLPDFHVHCALLSLPRIFRTNLANIPNEVPYLYADPGLVAHWRRRLADVRGFRVGINWQGNTQYKGDRYRSFPVDHFAAIAEVPGVQLVNLQKGQGADQLAAFAGKHAILSFEDLDEGKGAFMDTAAVMMNLDLVITSDTSIAHLAGGLGVPTWLPLSWASDWRWLERREDCPWYPTMRLFRQAEPGDWPEVFARMAAQVRVMAEEPRPRRPLTVEVSAGELIDKITILEIKAERMSDATKLEHVRCELDALRTATARTIEASETLTALTVELKRLNQRIWDAVDAIHRCEAEGCFGEEFIQLARTIYLDNDLRADVKRQINELLESRFVEEKHYTQ